MKKSGIIIVLGLSFVLTGCVSLRRDSTAPVVTEQSSEDTGLRPRSRPTRASVPDGARTVEDFDTTTAAERAEALSPEGAEGSARPLGVTVASLGDVTEGGFWLKTPLVSARTAGRVQYEPSGTSAQVILIPIEGAATAGSRISLAAMRVLGAPLTSLSEITVFAE